MTTATLPDLGTRAGCLMQDWLDERKQLIGASESPTILGLGYEGENAYTLWAKKCGLIEDMPDREDLEWGREMQPVVLKMFQKKTGIQVRDLGEFTIVRHPTLKFIGATLDGIAETDDGLAVVESKNIGQYNAKEWDDDEPPLRVNVQIQHQMLAAGAQVGYAVACIGGRKLHWRKVQRNDKFIEVLIPKLAAFWQAVESKTPPEVDGSLATAKVLAKLHPEDSGETIVLPPESADWTAQLEQAKASIKAAEALKTDAENRIKAALGDATFGMLPDGSRWSWKSQDRAGYTVEPTTFRVLRKVK